MIRVSRWLFAFLVPIAFMGGCGLLLPPIMVWEEHERIRPLPDKTYDGPFPVLVKDRESGQYYVDRLGDLPPSGSIVTNGFDLEKIEHDLNLNEAGRPLYRKIRVLKLADGVTEISLRSPASEGEIRSWYEIRDGDVVPKAILDVRRVWPSIATSWVLPCGLASLIVFLIVVRRKPRPPTASNPEIFRDILGSVLSAMLGMGAGLFVVKCLIKIERVVMGLWDIDF